MYGSFNIPFPGNPDSDAGFHADPPVYRGGKRICTCKDDDPPYHIVVNTGQRRLYLYQSGKLLKSYPVAIGKPSTPTPKGEFKIVNKDPTPGRVFGAGWMGLSKPHYGIHGTNDPSSIGKEISDGCVRMYNQDLKELFYKLPIGTPVTIV